MICPTCKGEGSLIDEENIRQFCELCLGMGEIETQRLKYIHPDKLRNENNTSGAMGNPLPQVRQAVHEAPTADASTGGKPM